MSDARRGYTHAMARMVASMDQASPVAQFASYCIENDVPVDKIAAVFNVSRATVYNWFKGVYTPREKQVARMQEILAKVKSASA